MVWWPQRSDALHTATTGLTRALRHNGMPTGHPLVTEVGRRRQGDHRWCSGDLLGKDMEVGTHLFDVSLVRGGDSGRAAAFQRRWPAVTSRGSYNSMKARGW
jgi:hypothetical protein